LGDLSKMYLGLDALGAGASQLYIGVVVLGPPYSFYYRVCITCSAVKM